MSRPSGSVGQYAARPDSEVVLASIETDAEQGPIKGEDVKDGRVIVSVGKTF